MSAELPRTDQLALQRTRLANERTFLAYVRTALALLGAGIGLLEFVAATPAARLAGLSCVAAGVVMFPLGIWRYLAVRRTLR